ncbi:MAG: hypothetical protein WCA84_14770 [Ignavibacteriaceae bacterium]
MNECQPEADPPLAEIGEWMNLWFKLQDSNYLGLASIPLGKAEHVL